MSPLRGIHYMQGEHFVLRSFKATAIGKIHPEKT